MDLITITAVVITVILVLRTYAFSLVVVFSYLEIVLIQFQLLDGRNLVWSGSFHRLVGAIKSHRNARITNSVAIRLLFSYNHRSILPTCADAFSLPYLDLPNELARRFFASQILFSRARHDWKCMHEPGEFFFLGVLSTQTLGRLLCAHVLRGAVWIYAHAA